jgi:uncharacterized repeat protein (TIGR01451 family)/uncharacterized delta-60 repeat protein
MKAKLTFLLAILSYAGCLAQTIFSENMGTPAGTVSIVANTFERSSILTYSNGGQTNSADLRITSASNGYANSSGVGNVFFSASSGTYGFSIEGINASNYNTLSLQFGYKKEAAASHASFSVDYWNGTAWTTLANSASALFNEAAGASAVWYLSKSLPIPNDGQINGLKIRFIKSGTVSIRIDDVKLTGTEIVPSVTNTAAASITSNSVTFAGNVTATGGSSITATGTVYSITSTNANPLLAGSGVTTISTPNPNTGTGTFSNGSGAVLSPNVQYSYNAYATKSSGATGYGTAATFYTLAVTPVAPNVGSVSASSLNVTIGTDANSSITTYSIYETTTNNYVQANGTLGNTAVFQTVNGWGQINVSGLLQNATYTFIVTAKNGAGVITSTGPSANGTTLLPANNSDIILNSSSSTNSNSNIDYSLYQGTTLNNTGSGINGSVGVLGFYVRDGGSGMNDADTLPTEVTSLTVQLVNSANIRSARLFVGTSPRGVPIDVNGASVITFSNLTNIIAPDNDQVAINLRITFKSTVTDNQQIGFIITGVTAKDSGSQFGSFNGGGVNSLTTGDINRIEVTATRLAFLQQPPASLDEKTNMTPSPSIQAVDNNGSLDLDFYDDVSVTSTGVLMNSPQIVGATSGLATFNTINHDSGGTGILLTASSSGLVSVNSSSFNIFSVPKFDEFGSYIQNSNIPDMPLVSTNGINGSWSPAINNMATTIYTFTPSGGQNARSVTSTIEVFASPFPGDLYEEMALFDESCMVNGVNVHCTSSTRKNYVNPNPSSNNFCTPIANISPCASSLSSTIVLTFNAPITSIRIPFSVMDNFTYLDGTLAPDRIGVIINGGGQLSYTNLCGLVQVGNLLVCSLPVRPPGQTNSGNTAATISSTLPFTSLTLSRQGPSSFSTHPCKMTNIVTCLAGSNAPSLSSTSVNNLCPVTNASLNSLTANNQPSNTTLTWHTTTPANGSSLVTTPGSVGAGTYYAAFYDTVNHCYSPTSVAVTVTINQCLSDLSVTKTVNNSSPAYNSNVVFTITATNNGPSPATGVNVNDVLPSGYTFVQATNSVGSWSAPNWIIGNLAIGVSATLNITAKVGCGNYSNTATITGNQTDSNTSNNSASASVNPLLVINAVNDDFSSASIPVCAGGQTTSVFSNDTLNCYVVNSTTVSASITNNGGVAGASINSNGLISIPSSTAAGTYFITYRICEILNSSNCDTAIVKIIVKTTLVANDDDFSSTPINSVTGGFTDSVFDNDTLDGGTITPSNMTFSFVMPLSIPGASINSLGEISVPPSTTPGTYTLTYQVYQNACPMNFDTATIVIYVSAPFITTPPISNSIRANAMVRDIELQSTGKIIISGQFTTYNNIAKKFIAKLNTDLTLDIGFTPTDAIAYSGGQQYFAPPNDLKIQADDKIIVVTDAPYAYGGSAGIARFNQNGTIDPTFVTGSGISHSSGSYCTIETCAVQQDGKILIGGYFDTYNGTPVRSMIRLHTNGSIDNTFTFPYATDDQWIHEIEIMPSGDILVSGLMFPTQPIEALQRNLVKLDINGNPDPSFTIGFTGLLSDYNPQAGCVDCSKFHILKMKVLPDSKILVSGSFDRFGTTAVNNIVRLNSNGTVDGNFNFGGAGANRVIYDFELENPLIASSKILFCGEFTTYNGNPVKKMARMTYDGGWDPSFNIGSGTLDSSAGTVPNKNFIRSLHKQSDGKVIVGGKFTSFNGIVAGHITRILGDNGFQAKNNVNVYVSEPEIDINLSGGNIRVYPNPSIGIYNIDLTNEEGNFEQINIYNLIGSEVYKTAIISKELNQIDISHLPSGYYIAKISNGNTDIQFKLLKK